MKLSNSVVAALLAVATTVLSAVFFLGTPDQHQQLLYEKLWSTFNWRFYGFSALSLIGAAVWWTVNLILLKSGFVSHISLGRVAVEVVAASIGGSLLGAIVFCFI
jgi:hypothetical protein